MPGFSDGNAAPAGGGQPQGGGQQSAARQGAPAGGDGGGQGAPHRGGEGGAPEIDINALREQLGGVVQPLARQVKELTTYNQRNQQFFDRMKGVFAPEDGGGAPQARGGGQGAPQGGKGGKASQGHQERVQHYEQNLEGLLQAALESERAGKPIPWTANIGAEFFQFAMEQAQRNAALEEDLAAIRARQEKVDNPRNAAWNNAMMDFDSMIKNSMETIYGPGDETRAQKNGQWNAVSQQMMAELKELANEDPDALDELLRSPRKRQQMVSHFVTQNIPPRARQILERERLEQEEMGVPALKRALQQAQRIEDPREREAVTTLVRRQLLSQKFVDMRSGRGRGQNVSDAYDRPRERSYRSY